MHGSLHEIGPITSIGVFSDEVRNNNVRLNCERNSNRLPDNLPVHDRTASLVCFGPSLKHSWPALLGSKDVFCVGAAHSFLIARGIIPQACIDCDPRWRVVNQMGKPHADVEYWLASCVSPNYLDRLQGRKVKLWHVHNGQESADFVWSLDPEAWLCIGGGSVGLMGISLLYAQGYRSFEIHGMDSSYEDDNEHAGSHTAPAKKQIINIKCKERWFKTSPSLIEYARQFVAHRPVMWKDATFRLHGDGLLQEMCR